MQKYPTRYAVEKKYQKCAEEIERLKKEIGSLSPDIYEACKMGNDEERADRIFRDFRKKLNNAINALDDIEYIM